MCVEKPDRVIYMMYSYITIGDDIEVTHSHLIEENGEKRVYVHFERPIKDEKRAFDEAECVLPEYEWIKRIGFTSGEFEMFDDFLRNNAHLLYKYAESGGIRIA